METTLPVTRDGLRKTRSGFAGDGRNSKTGCVGKTENSRLGGWAMEDFVDPFRTLKLIAC